MADSHSIAEVEHEGFAAVALSSPAGLTATYVPGAGMVCASLRDGGDELLGQRHGLAAYASDGKTMGIPLLFPWANRLARYGYAVDDVRVEIPVDPRFVSDDGSGLPIHGIVPPKLEWKVVEQGADAGAARLVAELDAGSLPDVLALFPFPHRLRMAVTLRERALEVAVGLHAEGDRRVPVAFGFHPYFQLPGVPRAEWVVALPVRQRAVLTDQLLPSGRTEPVAIETAKLGDRTYDDLFPETDPEPVFALAGGGRRIEVAFGPTYPVAVIYAPDNDDVVCFEPMTAQTNPFEGPGPLRWVEPGERFEARFEVRVLPD